MRINIAGKKCAANYESELRYSENDKIFFARINEALIKIYVPRMVRTSTEKKTRKLHFKAQFQHMYLQCAWISRIYHFQTQPLCKALFHYSP